MFATQKEQKELKENTDDTTNFLDNIKVIQVGLNKNYV